MQHKEEEEELKQQFQSDLEIYDVTRDDWQYKFCYLKKPLIFKMNKSMTVHCMKLPKGFIGILDTAVEDMNMLNKLTYYLARKCGFNTVTPLLPGYTIMARTNPLTTYWDCNNSMISGVPAKNKFKAQVAVEIVGIQLLPTSVCLCMYVDQVKVLGEIQTTCMFA